jgi:hypothetical protein
VAAVPAANFGVQVMKSIPGKPPRLETIHSSYEHPLFFITFNTMRRQAVLADDSVSSSFRCLLQTWM